MTQFRERNPVPIALVGLAGLLLVVLLAFNAGNIALLGGGGTTYHADFTEASDVRSSADVRIAGIKVGSVSSVKLAGDHVRIGMKLDPGTKLGTLTRADIKIKTLLGQMYVSLTPDGPGQLNPHQDIPLDRTTTPLIVTAAFEDLATHVQAIDVTQLQDSFNVLAADFANTPDTVSQTLRGLSRLSNTIASRNAELQQLLQHAQGVSATLASRNAQVTALINDGDTVLQLVSQQRDVIHALLVNTSTLSQQISALVAENQGLLTPALRNLQSTVDILTKDQGQLDRGIHLLAPFLRDFTNTLGNGRWFDTIVQNLSDLGRPGCFTVTPTGVPVSGGALTQLLNGAVGAGPGSCA